MLSEALVFQFKLNFNNVRRSNSLGLWSMSERFSLGHSMERFHVGIDVSVQVSHDGVHEVMDVPEASVSILSSSKSNIIVKPWVECVT